MSSFANLFHRICREIKTRKSTDVVKTDRTFIVLPKYLQSSFLCIHLSLISHSTFYYFIINNMVLHMGRNAPNFQLPPKQVEIPLFHTRARAQPKN